MRKHIFIALFGMLLVIFIAGCTRMVTVSAGEKTVCSECRKIISSDIKTLKVPEQEMANYSVRETTAICDSCQAKITEKKRQEEARKREMAVRAERERQAAIRQSVVARWVFRVNGSDLILNLSSDGTGEFNTYHFKWKPSSKGFTGTVHWVTYFGKVPRTSTFSGEVIKDGRQLLVDGWSWDNMQGWGPGQSIFDRVD